ncbi:peroxiredoxin [Sphingomicrobium clamense]|uniref:thioredoxin-dependent peroxiredoxin n=1 Tax=Sphingomicrobium clamense TaxID=2851013 RepID=A0ABS6V5S5_9SPHN|nr:peroxiredoxin [Sphingomicrobium sp. B8]MBW0144428.1 peroxiredoxin [Sphingomicrobium sp. B8]
MMGVGDKVPSLKVEPVGGEPLDLGAPGRTTVLFFYPKDMTPGCTTESIDFTGLKGEFEKAGAQVIGVSRDSEARHEKFIAKHDLTVPLISDEDGAVSDAFGTWGLKKFMGREFMGMIRSTFVIGADGTIKAAWPKVRVKNHAAEVLEAVKGL